MAYDVFRLVGSGPAKRGKWAVTVGKVGSLKWAVHGLAKLLFWHRL